MHVSHPPIRESLRWLPLAALSLLLAASMLAGRGSFALDAGATAVPVSGSVSSTVFVDASACLPAAVAIGDLLPSDPWKTAQDNGGQTCNLSFGSPSHAPGTTLTILEDPAAASSPAAAMKCVSGGCTGHALADYSNASGEPTVGTSAFGMQLLGASGAASGLWNAAPAVYPVANGASSACATASTSTGACSFTFGAAANAGDPPGSYQAQALALAIGN